MVMLASTAVLRSPAHLSKPVIVLLVTHPCLLHSCTKTQTNQGYVAFIGHFCPLKKGPAISSFPAKISLVWCFFVLFFLRVTLSYITHVRYIFCICKVGLGSCTLG